MIAHPQLQSPVGSQDIYLGRQPILDRNQRLVAFELLFRAGRTNSAQFPDGTAATATVIRHVMNEFGLEAVLGRYRGFINLDDAMLQSDMIELLPKEKVVLEILETVKITDAVVDRCRWLKRVGFSLALDDVVHLPPEYEPLLDVIDVIKVDLTLLDQSGLRALVKQLKPWRRQLLAEKVDDAGQVKTCLDLGFDLFQGYYFAKPQIMSGRRMSPAQTLLMRVLGLVLSDAEADEIGAVLKHEPTLTMNLLRLTNSVASGASRRITSIEHAILTLGRRQLQRWLQILLYSGTAPDSELPTPLMQLAATRGKLMELLAARWRDKSLEDRAFMTGIMSLMESVLGMPMAEIVAPLAIGEEVKAALLARDGRLGALLRLTEALERADEESVRDLLTGELAYSPAELHAAQGQALAWANSMGDGPA